ncbi:hypothetical protein RRG08_006863 [Elysia crispata]|uniref:Glutamate receptor n=1 Tax=Elysia crispata TaxID=231223 RepID=A0AAE1B7Q3_9GAST|nr:hypothetical protein RRG08_006863 [Elysia crispata]
MKFVICLLGVTVYICVAAADEQLRVALKSKKVLSVPETSLPIAELALENSNLVDSFKLLPVTSGNMGSSFASINKTFFEISDLDLDAIVGPFDMSLDLVAESLDIPYLSLTHDTSQVKKRNTFEMLPDTVWAGRAILDIIEVYGWAQIALFHDDYKGVPLVEQLVTDHSVLVRAWRLPAVAERHHVNQALIQMRKSRIQTILVMCSKENTRLMLDEALNLAMLSTPPYHWMFYDPCLESQEDLTKYTQIQVNFTVISLVDFNNTLKAGNLSKTELALGCDAFSMLISFKNQELETLIGNSSSPQNDTGSKLGNSIRKASLTGHTGKIAFDPQGQRMNVTLTLSTVSGDHTYPRGMWYSHTPMSVPNLILNTAIFPLNQTRPFPLVGRKVKVVIIENKPFTMLKRDHASRQGNDRFEGFSIDLIEYVAKELEFDYELYLVHDGKFGSQMPDGRWNGVIGELIAGNATMSVAPLSINANRESAVDFTKPFMTRHISVLMRVPTYETSYFQFLNPFSPMVWMIIMLAFLVVSWILYGLEKVGRSLDRQTNKDLPPVTIRESVWFIFGSLVQGSTEPVASSLPGRILTSAWWFFALILISSYTANLAAFLTVKKIATPINSVTDLAQQTKIKYGTVKDTGVKNFFKNTQIDYFAKMWAQMSEVEPDTMVDNETAALKKVKTENYAFFWDSTVNKYHTQTDCDLMEVGPAFDPKGFGIGVPPGASYLDQLSMAILKMSDRGILEGLQSKWWDISNCPDLSGGADETSSLQIENVAGVFFIVVGGIVLASLVCLAKYWFPNVFRIPEMVTQKSFLGAMLPKKVNTDDDGVDAEQL